MESYSSEQARDIVDQLIERAGAGEDIMMTSTRSTRVRLVLVDEDEPKAQRQPGSLKGKIAFDDRFFEPLPEEELRLWNCEDD